MSKKTSFEKFAAKGLTDPTYPPGGEEELGSDDKMSKGLEGVPFTEPNQADISRAAKVVLGTFLSAYTKNGRRGTSKEANEYSPPMAPARAVSSKRGNPIPKPDPNATQFTTQDEKGFSEWTGLGVPSRDKLGTFFKGSDQLGNLLDKTGATPALSGHKLLKEIQEGPDVPRPGEQSNYHKPAAENKYLNYVYKQLIEANLYHPSKSSPFLPNPASLNEEEATKGLFTIQRNLGSFDNDGQRVKVSDMSAMAFSLLARSVGDHKAANLILAKREKYHLNFGAEAIVHQTEQLAFAGVAVHNLRLKGLVSDDKVLKKIIAAAKGSDDMMATKSQRHINNRGIAWDGDDPKLQSSPYGSVSYGQLNSFLEPFGGMVGSPGMLLIATEGILALLAISIVVDALSFTPGGKSFVRPDTPQKYSYGVHGKKGTGLASILYELLRITDTDYDFGNCVGQGIALLLGFSPEGGTSNIAVQIANPAGLVTAAMNLVLSPGYYATMFRQIILSVQEVIASFRDIGAGGFSSAGFTSMVVTIEKVVSSKAYLFLMIAAGVGDAALKSSLGMTDLNKENTMFSKEDMESVSANDMFKVNEKYELLPGTKIGAVRKHLSRWGSTNANPLSLHTFLASNVAQQSSAQPSPLRDLKPGRDTVKQIEAALEAEYVPFYFHDLRTHEVISLPAFIDAFDETFNVNYNSVTGYGRQDPVRLYQNTERTMNFSFKLVAFNDADFNELWYTVNKMVSMCYPQYSRGRDRSFKDGEKTVKFIQPFSQIPAASPVIRLRLGDVLKSNYSMPSLARLFGATGLQEKRVYDEVVSEVKSKIRNNFEKSRSDKTQFSVQAAAFGKLKDPTKSYELQTILVGGAAAASAVGGSFNKDTKTVSWPGGTLVTIESANPMLNPFFGDPYIPAAVKGKSGAFSIKINVAVSDIVFDETRVAFHTKVKANPKVMEAKAALDAAIAANPGVGDPKVRADFFTENNNAIVRSFNSTRGKGMAGVITSLGLNYGTYPWEISPGKRAPKVIDVTLAFAPIHDLPLGLDYNGQIRAPSHPVGDIAGGFGNVYGDSSELTAAGTHVAAANKDVENSGYGEWLDGKASRGSLSDAVAGAGVAAAGAGAAKLFG